MPIFVAGTARSGTTQLSRILGDHPEVFTVRNESWFIVGPGGLEDVVRDLTCAYTPQRADETLTRLEYMLIRRVAGKERSIFSWWDLPEEAGPNRYRKWVNQLLAELTWYSFDEDTHPPGGGEIIRVRRRVGRYFPDRADIVAICRRFVDDLFSGMAREHGKPIWCEKTPFNLLSMAFLWELFPNAKIVHIVRDPMEVVSSHLDRDWAPHDVDSVCSWLEPVYLRWLSSRDACLRDDRYVEVRLEELAADWPRQRALLFSRLGLPDTETEHTMEDGRVIHDGRLISFEHTGRRFTPAERDLVRRRLGFVFKELGYH